jgi:hypothetical protein
LSDEALTPEILRGGEVSQKRFDPKSAAPFVNKSVSEATRRAYGRAVREFFQLIGMKHPSEVVPNDVVLWRDRLRIQKKSAATITSGWLRGNMSRKTITCRRWYCARAVPSALTDAPMMAAGFPAHALSP